MLTDVEVVSGRTSSPAVVQVPDVATALAFRTTASGRSDLFVVGPRTRGRYHPGRGVPVCVRLRLRPGLTRPLLGVSAAELVDKTVRITDLWGAAGTRLTEALVDAGADVPLIVSRLEQTLVARSATAVPESGVLEAATHALATSSRLAPVAADLGVSERHLRNLFTREIGLSPKHYARITRLRRILARAGTDGWPALAHEAGFFDQAHMITDFRAFMGVSPAAYVAGHLPPTTPCADLTRPRP